MYGIYFYLLKVISASGCMLYMTFFVVYGFVKPFSTGIVVLLSEV